MAALQPQPWQLADPPPGVRASGGEPQLWQLDIRDPLRPEQRQALLATLSPAERTRLLAYRQPVDRERFLRCRAGLRRLLGSWQGCPSEAVTLAIGAHGKPFCAEGPAFNVSHSGDLIVLALHPQHPVGVDVERLRPDLNGVAIARRVFRSEEQTQLMQLPAAEQPAGFLALWCALEAELKASGSGFSGLEHRRNTTPAPPQGSTLQRWTLTLPEGYCGAVVMLG